MKVFTCTDHMVMYPVGGASIVIAASEEEAHKLLFETLSKHFGIKPDPFTLQEHPLDVPSATILRDGDY